MGFLSQKLTSLLLMGMHGVFSVGGGSIVPAAAETTDETSAMDTVRGSNILGRLVLTSPTPASKLISRILLRQGLHSRADSPCTAAKGL